MENDLTTDTFNYELIDNEQLATELMQIAHHMQYVGTQALTLWGADLYTAQDKIASRNHNQEDTFIQWAAAQGFKKRTAYNLINRYKKLQSISDPETRQIFEELPKSLAYEISKPSTDEDSEAVQAVFDGDVTTLKEYKELKAKYDEKNDETEELKTKVQNRNDELEEMRHDAREQWFQDQQKIKQLDKKVKDLTADNQKLRQQTPAIQTIETIPEDYELIKQQNAELMQTNEDLKQDLKEQKQSIEALNREIQDYEDEMKGLGYSEDDEIERQRLQEEIDGLQEKKHHLNDQLNRKQKTINDLVAAEDAFHDHLAPLQWAINYADEDAEDPVVSAAVNLVNELQSFCNAMYQRLPKGVAKQIMVEGDFDEAPTDETNEPTDQFTEGVDY